MILLVKLGDRRTPGAAQPWPQLAVALLGCWLALAGCYGNTQPVTKIGLLAPFEELYRDDGYAALHAVKLAIGERNARGGVGGRQIALVALNDNGRPEEAALQARKLGVDRDVLGVIGPLHHATAAAAAAELAAQDLSWIAPAPLDSGEMNGGWSLSASPYAIGHGAVMELARQGDVDRVTVFSDQPGALAGARAAADSLALPLAALPLDADATDVPADSSLAWLGDAERGAALLSALAATGSSPVLVGGPEVGSPVFERRAPLGAAAAWLTSGPSAADLPPEFVTAYQQLAGAAPSPQAVLAYDATNLLLDAIAAAASVQDSSMARPAVHQAIHDLVVRGWTGLAGPFVWTERNCAQQADCGQWLRAPLYVQHGGD